MQEKNKWEGLHGTLNYQTFQLQCAGIKPGVKPPLLFRLDATKQRAIWQTVRQLNTVYLLQLFCLYHLCLGRVGLQLRSVKHKLCFLTWQPGKKR